MSSKSRRRKKKYPMPVSQIQRLSDEVRALREILHTSVKASEFYNGAIWKLIDKGVITIDEIDAKIREQKQAAKIKAEFEQREAGNAANRIRPEEAGEDEGGVGDGGQPVFPTEGSRTGDGSPAGEGSEHRDDSGCSDGAAIDSGNQAADDEPDP